MDTYEMRDARDMFVEKVANDHITDLLDTLQRLTLQAQGNHVEKEITNEMINIIREEIINRV